MARAPSEGIPEERVQPAAPAGSRATRAAEARERQKRSIRHLTWLSIVFLITVPPAVAMVVFPHFTDNLGDLQLAGVFVVNLCATLTLLPIPGLTGLGQAVIVRLAGHSPWPVWSVGVVGGLGLGLGEIAPYYLGRLSFEVARERRMKAPARLRPFVEAAGRRFNWLMQHWTWPTLFVLSAVPNPFFELAGFSAGSTRIGLGRFLPPTVMGKVLRGCLLAYVGAKLTIL